MRQINSTLQRKPF